jgi:undecaprenyl-diphosphatase
LARIFLAAAHPVGLKSTPDEVLPFPRFSPYTAAMRSVLKQNLRQNLGQSLRTFPWAQQIICFLPLCILLVLLALVFGTGNEIAGEFQRIRAGYPDLTAAMRIFSSGTQYVFYAVWLGLFLYGLRAGNRPLARRALYFFCVQFIFAFVLARVVKVSFGLPRPYATLEGAVATPFTLDSDHHSFPSGHTSTDSLSAACTAAFWRSLLPALLLGFILAGIGFSRIYLGMHHIFDISGGLVIGVLGNFCFHYLCKRDSL